MCGRYTQTAGLAALAERFGFVVPAGLELRPRYNLAPGQDAPVVVWNGGSSLRLLSWGLIPSRASDPASCRRMINARAETLLDRPAFKGLLSRRRCLVLADGFYEWKASPAAAAEAPADGELPFAPPPPARPLPSQGQPRRARPALKVPVRFRLKDGRPFAFAGVWDERLEPRGERRGAFAIVTTRPNDLVRPVHERMPAILRPEHEAAWLTRVPDRAGLAALLAPYPSSEMDGYEVSRLVNKPGEDSPACIQPLAASRRAPVP